MKITTLEDLVGIEHTKLGFYQELQQKVEQLKTSNLELEKKRKEIQAVLDGITDLMLVLTEDLILHGATDTPEAMSEQVVKALLL